MTEREVDAITKKSLVQSKTLSQHEKQVGRILNSFLTQTSIHSGANDGAMYLGQGHGPVQNTLPKDIFRGNYLSVDLEGFHSTDSKTLDHEDSLDHQEFKNHSVSKRSVIK